MKGKKGSHIEMIISFILFVSAVMFAYTIIEKPLKFNVNMDSVSGTVHKKIMNYLAEEAIIVRLSHDGSSANINFTTPNISWMLIPEAIAVDENFTQLPVYFDSSNTVVSVNNSKLIKVYYVDHNASGAENLSLQSYANINGNVSNVNRKKIMFENKIINVLNFTRASEFSFRDKIGIASKYEFDISFDYLNGTVISSNNRSVLSDVYSRNNFIFYINKTGGMNVGKIYVKVW